MTLLDEIRDAHDRSLDAIDLGDDRVLVFQEPASLSLKFEPPSMYESPHTFVPRVPYGTVLYRDGWERENLASVTVEIETDVHAGDPAFVRTEPSGIFTRVGSFRIDDHAGTCIRMQGFTLAPFGSYQNTRYPVAVLSQIDRRVGWHRHASGDFLTLERAASGRYDSRPPTNRKRKRERCKARRRARKPSQLPAWLRETRAYRVRDMERLLTDKLAKPGPEPK